MFKLATTFSKPSASQSGMAPIGDGLQYNADGFRYATPAETQREPARPTKGFRSWLAPLLSGNVQRGYPSPDEPNQRRVGQLPDDPIVEFGGVYQHETPYYSRGAAAYVPNFGKIYSNPIGAGIPVAHRPQASYGGAAQYANGQLFWTTQAIPTSTHLSGLSTAEDLSAILNDVQIEAVVRTTG